MLGKAHSPDLNVGYEPNDGARRHSPHHRPPQHDERPVDHRCVESLPDSRRTVRRELEAEERCLSFEDRFRQSPGDEERHADTDHHNRDDRKRRDQAGEGRRSQRPDKDGGNENLCGPSAVADGKIVCQDGDEAFAGAVDDPRRDDRRGVAAVSHGHRQRLFPVRTRLPEEAVEVEGNARKITEILCESKERKEDRHGRKHHAHHPGHRKVHSVEHKAVQPPRETDPCTEILENGMKSIQKDTCKERRRHIGAFDGNPEDHGEDEHHEREPGPSVGNQAIEDLVKPRAHGSFRDDGRAGRNPCRLGIERLNRMIMKIFAQIPSQRFNCLQNLFTSCHDDPLSLPECFRFSRLFRQVPRIGQPR